MSMEENGYLFQFQRFMHSLLAVRLGWDDSADVLGEEQWNWLEQELQSSHTGEEATIIVSSMQVRFTGMNRVLLDLGELVAVS